MIALLIFLGLMMAPGEAAQTSLVRDDLVGHQQGVEVREWTYMSGKLQVKGLLFLPPSAEPLPAVVFCHDGISGISREHRLSSLRLARAGYVVFSPAYRGEDGSEGVVEVAKGEVQDVLASLPLLAELPQVDGDRIALAGASHGALISALAAARSPRVKAVVMAYGVADIYSWWDYLKATNQLGNDPVTARTYGKGPIHRPHSFAIRNAVSVANSIDCPVLILQGEKDTIVPPDQALKMKAALDKAGKPNEMKLYPDCLHGFLVYAPYLDDADPKEKAQTEEAWATMLAFLERNLTAD